MIRNSYFMTQCTICGSHFENREGSRTSFLRHQCSRYCYEIANGVKPINGKIDVPCLVCGSEMSIDGVTNWKYAWMCSKACQNRTGRMFGRKSRIKYTILKGFKILGECSAKDISVWIEQTTPYRCSAGQVPALCSLYAKKGFVAKNKTGGTTSYKLTSKLPFEDYV